MLKKGLLILVFLLIIPIVLSQQVTDIPSELNGEVEYYGLSVFVIGLIIALLLYAALDAWLARYSLAYFIEKETKSIEKKGKEFIEKERKLILKKKKSNIKTITPLIAKILQELRKDEKKVIIKLIGNEGINKNNLKTILGFSKYKLDYCLIRLARRDIIKLNGDKYNPRIYINDWLK